MVNFKSRNSEVPVACHSKIIYTILKDIQVKLKEILWINSLKDDIKNIKIYAKDSRSIYL